MSDAQVFDELKESIISLDGKRVSKATQDALDQGFLPQEIISRGLAKGLEEIGEGFEQRKYFLPELIGSAVAMKSAFAILRTRLADTGVKAAGKVVIGSVEGDIHDIGKNILGAMLEGAGFQVYDVGVDVPAEDFVKKAREVEPDVIGLSALLSIAISKMAETVMILKENDIKAKVIVGGAAVTQQGAEALGADAYGKDAWEGVRLIQELVKGGTQT